MGLQKLIDKYGEPFVIDGWFSLKSEEQFKNEDRTEETDQEKEND